jgi:DNA-binding SARP family transcriptional activator/tetratricopeptide (TPR) repeat protein
MDARLLGPVEVVTAGRTVDLGRGKALSLMAVLLVHAGTAVPIERLLDLLWDGAPPRNGRGSLQVYVSRLRSRLAEAGSQIQIVTRGDTYAAELGDGETDLLRFRRLVDEARRADDWAVRASVLARAVGLWRGPPLADVQRGVRERLGRALQEEWLLACEQRAEAELTLGRHAEHAGVLAELVEAHPFRERLTWYLMLALYRSGRPAEALERYRLLARRLAEEHGTDPDPDLARLHAQILNADPALRLPVGADRSADTPRQLPSPPQHFTGRAAAAARLAAALLPPGGSPAAADVTATRTAIISGTGGVGKTALGLHWAQRHLAYFPDGQLYINLRGFGPIAEPKEPSIAVCELLMALGADAAQIPTELDAQAALYRSRLAGRAILVLLDNARDAAQVRPLLPGTPTCAVIITSRNPLAGLVAAEGATPVALEAMSREEANELLAGRIGAARILAEPDAADGLVRECARLPLALALASARISRSATLSLRDVAAELERQRGGLAAFASDDPATDIRTVFSWSYRTLTAPAARLFRLLSHHAGPTITVGAAASLMALPDNQTAPLLGELVSTHLLAEHAPGEYEMHDLLVAYARDLDRTAGDPDDSAAAADRLLHHHLQSLWVASDLAFRERHPLDRPPQPDGVTVPAMHSREEALGWFAESRAVLLAAIQHAAAVGQTDHAWRLAWLATTFLDRDGRWFDIVAAHRAVLDAARRADNRLGEAYSRRGLCRALTLLGELDQAYAHASAALEAYAALGDVMGMAAVQYDMAVARWRKGDLPGAVAASEEALRLYRAAGYRSGEAYALNATSWYHALLGDYAEALRLSRQALELIEGGERGNRAAILDTLGYLHHQLHDYDAAIDCYERALALQSGLGDKYEESMVLTHLGDTHLALGRRDRAARVWKRALAILTELGHSDADKVREKLTGM